MNGTINTFKKVARVALFVSFLIGMSNCNQFHTFSQTETDAHLSTSPVFEEPEASFTDDFTGQVVNDTDTGTTVTPITPVTVNIPPIRLCPNNNRRFQIINSDGTTYSSCERCHVWGTQADSSGTNHRVCIVQRCEGVAGPTQYRRLGNFSQDRTACRRCDVMDRTTGECTTRIVTVPPVVVTPDPIDEPVVVEPPVCTGCTCTNSCGGTVGGGDGGGDGGGGDPLMIDIKGDTYASQDEFKSRWEDPASFIKPGELNLTSPEDGIKFNLIGQQDKVQAGDGFYHIPEAGKNFEYSISWTDKNNSRYRWLALPDQDGKIKGIDQLFGDNTYYQVTEDSNPFAADGFQALVKHDSNQDQYIDENDPVYSKLRLWHDYNHNGKVDTVDEMQNELIDLRTAKIQFIHLAPNKNYWEVDDYGNEIAYKSLVKFNDEGTIRMGMAFDVWFHYYPSENSQAVYSDK